MINTITADPTFQALLKRLRRNSPSALSMEGLWGSSSPLVAACLARELQRPLVYITAHLDQADDARDDLEQGGVRAQVLPAFDAWPPDGAVADETAGQRVRACQHLQSDGTTALVVPILAMMQPVASPTGLAQESCSLTVGQQAGRESLVQWCVDQGFSRLEWVEAPGDFAVRGGILDIFPFEDDDPLRIELFDDAVESLRRFDLSSGRSHAAVSSVQIAGPRAWRQPQPEHLVPVARVFPAQTLVQWHEPTEIAELGRTYWERMNNPKGMFPVDRVFGHAEEFTQVFDARFGGMAVADGDAYRFDVASVQRFEGRAAKAVAALMELAKEREVTVWCDNEAERQRLGELLEESGGSQTVDLQLGSIHHGFEWSAAGRVFVPHHELFQRVRKTRKLRKAYASRPLDTWLDLKVEDVVVHVVHGIARFRGITPMQKGDSQKTEEYLTLEFADKATVHVPASQIDLVHKYIGAGDTAPTLSTLGGTRWSKTKQRVAESVSDFAEELLRVQAVRESLPGTAYPADTVWQREFEEEFEYTETEDQLKVMEEIRSDLIAVRPMDRLVCGDVGYGKTELAMRAAFKVVEYGRQVAVLVPTTVLAEQHYRTFRQRMAEYPFEIGRLSRLRSRKEQTQLLTQTRKGRVDVLIGTHRILSKDVDFKDLGLLIIDEEQRFGVEHKERLKRFREAVDVLTLTATPIPRTLHMSLLGIRDISALNTPPLDRRSIVTQIRQTDPDLIRSGILRELNRDGQVFFVHNRVHDIETVAAHMRHLVPDARVVVGHGQMSADDLENVMMQFLQRKADVLVCTSIIESGIDISSANTIFIDQADHFGLGDLHQLRGRVGRHRHRAYCYLLLPESRPITEIAAKRLKAVEEFSELGAGFKIAMRDLEIRGAGNILGTAQSGHIGAVGYEMYCRLLEQAVHRMKGEPDSTPRPVHLELHFAALIPKRYIRSDTARMEIYRRLAACADVAALEQIEQDMADAFGAVPDAVRQLLDMAQLRVLARPWGIRSIIAEPPDVVFTVEDLERVDRLFGCARTGTVRMPDPRTIHWRLPPSYYQGTTLITVLRRLFETADQTCGEASTSA